MNVLDGFLLLCAVAAVLLGWRLGLASGLASLLGVFAGGGAGFLLGGVLARRLALPEVQQVLVVMAVTVVGITAAQLVITRPAQRLHDRVSASRLGVLNRLGGSALALGFGVFAVWLLATALALSPATGLADMMRGSQVLVRMDDAVPGDAGLLLRQLELTTGRGEPNQVFTGLGLLPAPEVEPPDPGRVAPADRAVAAASVVRIMGHAVCGKTLSGSGVVVGEDLVVTNAHVVAGVPAPYTFPDGKRIGAPGTLVHFDPGSDLAVLRVPDLAARPLPLASTAAATGDPVVVAGYPDGGELSVGAGRVRGPVTASGNDIYGTSAAQRNVLVIAAQVLPGHSGGALLNDRGELAGIVFAAATDGVATGYAVSADEVAQAVAASDASMPMSAGPCVPEPAS